MSDGTNRALDVDPSSLTFACALDLTLKSASVIAYREQCKGALHYVDIVIHVDDQTIELSLEEFMKRVFG